MPISEGGAMLIAGGLSMAGAYGASALQNAGSRRRQETANQYNLEQWNRANAYNHPTQSMARLKEAGLNPNLIYGGSPSGSSGNADAVPTANAAPYTMDNPLQNLGQYADWRVKQAQINNLKVQENLINADIINRAAQTANTKMNTLFQSEGIKTSALSRVKTDAEIRDTNFNLQLKQKLEATTLQAAEANVRATEATTIGNLIDNNTKSLQQADAVKKLYYEAEAAKMALTGLDLQQELMRLEIKLNKVGIQKGDPIWARIIAQAASNETLGDKAKAWWEEAWKDMRTDNPAPPDKPGYPTVPYKP